MEGNSNGFKEMMEDDLNLGKCMMAYIMQALVRGCPFQQIEDDLNNLGQ